MVYLEGIKDQPISVHTYEVNYKKFGKYKPNKEYKNLIVSGAKHWKLPKEYIKFLGNIEIVKDE